MVKYKQLQVIPTMKLLTKLLLHEHKSNSVITPTGRFQRSFIELFHSMLQDIKFVGCFTPSNAKKISGRILNREFDFNLKLEKERTCPDFGRNGQKS